MKNREITDLMNEFRRRDINASEEGGSTITDSAAVQCILSAMQLVDHPDDKVARFHLVNSPLSKEIGLQKYDDDLLAAKVALGLRREIMEDGYGKIIERFVKVLAPSCNKREYQRLEKLLELAYQFQETASGARTKQFIKMINNTKVESPSASENIRVMTIFKSKGMQFDIVILPYLGSTLVRSEKYPEYIAGRENAVADIDLVIKYLKKNMRNLLPDKPAKYKKAFNDYEEGNVNESLSVLYVAMTRAIHELVMILKPKKPTKSKKSSTPNKGVSTLGSVLQGGLQGTGVKDSSTSTMSETDVLVWYEAGNLKWTKSKTKKVIDVESGESIRIGEVLSRRKKYRILSRITPSLHRSIRGVVENIRQPEAIQIAGQSGVNRELRFEGDSNLGREFALLWGKMIHACFEGWLGREVWLGEVAIDSEFLRGEVEEVLRREGYVGVRAEELNIDKDAVVSSFIEICQKPEIRAVLSRTRYASKDVEVQHERRFVVLDNERELMHGSIDRIVVERELGNVVNIEILDFKTDRKPVDVDENIFLENRRKFHEAQMEAYQRGMQKLYRIDRNRINVTLIFTSIGKAIPAF
jgi:ATP-dependent exoDNAse (exonuclease V) beta subunit